MRILEVLQNLHMRKIVISTLTALVSMAFLAQGVQGAVSVTNSVKAKGKQGQTLQVDKARGLNRNGAVITVTGRNFDERVGIYVALCVIPKKGQQPGPCGGGADMDGSSSASKWISSNPPSYGIELAQPFGFGGNFRVKIKVNSKIGKKDCRKVRCAITTRADHLQSADRSADVFIPVTFK